MASLLAVGCATSTRQHDDGRVPRNQPSETAAEAVASAGPSSSAGAGAAAPLPPPAIDDASIKDAAPPVPGGKTEFLRDACLNGPPDDSERCAKIADRGSARDVKVIVLPATRLALSHASKGAPRLSGRLAVQFANATDKAICLQHLDYLSLRMSEESSGRTAHIPSRAGCIALNYGGSHGRVVHLAPHESRTWVMDDKSFSADDTPPFAPPAGDYRVTYSVFEYGPPAAIIPTKASRIPLLELGPKTWFPKCAALLESAASWQDSVSSPEVTLTIDTM